MNAQFRRFIAFVNSDDKIQKKLLKAGKNYKGAQNEEAVFHAVLEPIAKEAGFSLALEDIRGPVQEMSQDEMNQIYGGENRSGRGFPLCNWVGFGQGLSGEAKEGSLNAGGACVILGAGH